MTKLFPLTLLLILGGLQTSCSFFQQQKHHDEEQTEESVKTPPPLHLGAVHQVYRNFALLRIIGPMPREGTVLISHPADGSSDRMGNLVVSSAQHRRGNIIAADIRSGWVMKGDRIFLYRSILDEATEDEEAIPDENQPVPEAPEDDHTEIDIPDFNSVPVVTEAGTNPLDIPAPLHTTPELQQDAPSLPEEEAPAATEVPKKGIPSKLLDIPDTLDGWD